MSEVNAKKVIFGVCGIGYGHSLRQDVIIKKLSQNANIVIVGFGNALSFFAKNYPDIPRVSVNVPWVYADKNGIDYKKSAALNAGMDYLGNNYLAIAKAIEYLGGRPDLVVSDYEPISAQMAYAYGVPLITIDQQSKFLGYDFAQIDDHSLLEERERLRLFFPQAKKRIACSFFKAGAAPSTDAKVQIVPSFIRSEIKDLKKLRQLTDVTNDVLVYLSTYSRFVQPLSEIADIFSQHPRYNFHVFSSYNEELESYAEKKGNVFSYSIGDSEFFKVLSRCTSVISTGGHNFLSELVYLNVPIYCVPLENYEQHFNAAMIQKYGQGVSKAGIYKKDLGEFLSSLDSYKNPELKTGFFSTKEFEASDQKVLKGLRPYLA